MFFHSQLSIIHFNLEHHLTCEGGSVTILNGGSFNSPIIGQYCGPTPAEEITSGSNKLFIFFNSDHSVPQGGFYATWKSDSLGERNKFDKSSYNFGTQLQSVYRLYPILGFI